MQDIIPLYISRIISTPLTDGLLARVVVVGGGGEGGDPGAEPLGPGLDGDHLLAQRREQLVRLAQQTRQLADGLHSTMFQYFLYFAGHGHQLKEVFWADSGNRICHLKVTSHGHGD